MDFEKNKPDETKKEEVMVDPETGLAITKEEYEKKKKESLDNDSWREQK